MISLTTESHLPRISLKRENRTDLVFKGAMLANDARVLRNVRTPELRTLRLYKTSVGKYVLESRTSLLPARGDVASRIQVLCFSDLDDIRDYLITEDPAVDTMVHRLIYQASHADWLSHTSVPATGPNKAPNPILPAPNFRNRQ